MSSPSLPQQIHKHFAIEDADIHLISRDSVIFQIHSSTLGLVSTFFDPFLSIPQPSSSQDEVQTIHLDESAAILELLLGIACGLSAGHECVYRASLDLIEDVLRAADKYEIHAAVVFFRKVFTTAVANEGFPNNSYTDPLRLYVICRRYEWFEESERAFQRTLDIDILSERYTESMRRLNPSDLVDMIMLRKKCKDEMRTQLEDPNEFGFVMSITNFPMWTCTMCFSRYATLPVLMAWRDIRDRVLEEIERCPSGASLALDRHGSPIHPLLRTLLGCWSCRKCGKAFYEIGRVLQGLQRAVKGCEQIADKVRM